MKTLRLTVPDNINEQEAKTLLAAKLYEKGALSMGQAAELAALSKRAFMEQLGNYGVSIFDTTATDLDKDLLNAQHYHL
jgi:predicted HTH domain antitoxin